MNAQEYYNLLVKTSKEGGFPAKENGEPKYFCKDGRRCPVGLIIPDNIKIKEVDGSNTAYALFDIIETWFPEGMNVYDLQDIQDIHDEQGKEWSHEGFVKDLNKLGCFAYFDKEKE